MRNVSVLTAEEQAEQRQLVEEAEEQYQDAIKMINSTNRRNQKKE